MRVLVATVVHRSDDARIFHRQITALLDAGHEVVYVAPGPPSDHAVGERLRLCHVPRSRGWHRLGALVAAARVLRIESPSADLTIVHDPELTILAGMIRSPRIWDVHEYLEAQIGDKPWIPRPLVPLARTTARAIVRFAERRFSLLLAEDRYVERLGNQVIVRNHPVVPDRVRPSEFGRVVYVGRVSRGRGLDALVSLGSILGGTCSVEVIGEVDPSCREAVADVPPGLIMHGSMPNPVALDLVEGATAGLCLLRDLPNYRHSVPTKILEYMARGVPVITTPLPEARAIVERHGCGIVVPFDDPAAVVTAVRSLRDDDLRTRLASNGRRAAAAHFDGVVESRRFVAYCEMTASR